MIHKEQDVCISYTVTLIWWVKAPHMKPSLLFYFLTQCFLFDIVTDVRLEKNLFVIKDKQTNREWRQRSKRCDANMWSNR